VTDNIHIHRLRITLEQCEESPYRPLIFIRIDDLKYALDRLDHLQKAIEDFEPLHASDADWKDEALS
jgi:hypothetical protein